MADNKLGKKRRYLKFLQEKKREKRGKIQEKKNPKEI